MHYWLTWLLEKVGRRWRIIFYLSIHLWVQPYLYISFISFADTKRVKVTTTRTKSKIHIQHPAMIWIHIWKIKGYFKFLIVSYSENCILDAKRQKTSVNSKDFIENGYIPISPLSITCTYYTMLRSISLCFIRREFDLSASYGSTFLSHVTISEKFFLQENSTDIW